MAPPRPGHVSRSWPRIHFCTYIHHPPFRLSLVSLEYSFLFSERRIYLFCSSFWMYICFDFSFKFLTMRRRLRWWVYGLMYFCLCVGFLSYFLKYNFNSDIVRDIVWSVLLYHLIVKVLIIGEIVFWYIKEIIYSK